MKKLAIIIAILMAASSICACSQAEKANPIQQKPTYSATADEAKSRINTDVFGTETAKTENAEKSPVSAFQETSGVYPTTAEKADVGQMSRQQGGVSENDGSMQNSESSVTQSSGGSGENTPKQSGNSQSSSQRTTEKPQSKPAPKPTQATQPKATEAPKPNEAQRKIRGRAVRQGNIARTGLRQLGMVPADGYQRLHRYRRGDGGLLRRRRLCPVLLCRIGRGTVRYYVQRRCKRRSNLCSIRINNNQNPRISDGSGISR